MKNLALPDNVYDLLHAVATARGHENVVDLILLCLKKAHAEEVDQIADEGIREMLNKAVDPIEVIESWISIPDAQEAINNNPVNIEAGRTITYHGVFDAVKAGRLPAHFIGRMWYVDPAAAAEYILSGAGPKRQSS